ncbi:MAG: hypothetical protein ACK4IT_01395 [Thioalkalivibrionaceae bacterium]
MDKTTGATALSTIAPSLWLIFGLLIIIASTATLVACWRHGRKSVLAYGSALSAAMQNRFRTLESAIAQSRQPFLRTYARAVRARERAAIAHSVITLEGRFYRLLQRDLAQLPDLRQYAQDTLKRVENGFAVDERRMLEEPAWVLRLESLAKVPASVALQGEKLARDIEETLLRIARLGLEEHQQQARLLLEERRRSEPLLYSVVKRLEAVQRELHQLAQRSREIDQRLTRFFTSRDVIYSDPVAQWRWISRGIVALLGLALVVVAASVGTALFEPAFVAVFAAESQENILAARGAMLLFAGAAILGGALLVDGLRSTTWSATMHFEHDGLRRTLALFGAALLIVLIGLAIWIGWMLDWLSERERLLELFITQTDVTIPDIRTHASALGAMLGAVVVIILATTTTWLAATFNFFGLLLRCTPVVLFTLLLGFVAILRVLATATLAVGWAFIATLSWPLRHRAAADRYDTVRQDS